MRKLIKMRAGQYSQSMGRETVCLSPLPLPTGTAGISKTLFLQTNQTYLDFGAKDAWGFEYVIRVYTGIFVLFFMFFLGLPPFLFAFDTRGTDQTNYWLRVIDVFKELLPTMAIPLGLIIILFLTVFSYVLFSFLKGYPIRFNREKRQAACQLDNGEVYFIDWERINAQVEQAAIISTRYIIKPAQLSLYFPHPNDKDAFALSLSYGTELSALGEWEAIRRFMDNGLDDLKQHLYTTEELADQKAIKAEQGTLRYYNQQCASNPFGSVLYFYALKAKKKLEKDSYHLWCFWQLCSGWTLPCHIAALLNKIPTRGFNKEVLDWSTPIPKRDWQSPSEALIKQSDQLTQAYAQGVTFKQYFTQINSEQ